MENQAITFEQAVRILSQRVIVGEAGICETPITVGNVSVGKNIKDESGKTISVEPFYWEDNDGNPDTTRPYYIVNLRAMSEHQAQVAEELLDADLFAEAVGSEKGAQGNFSLRMSPEDVAKNGIATGAIVKATFDFRENSEEEEVLVCVAIAPIIAKAKRNSFKDRLPSKAGKEGADISSQPSTQPQENA